jgi:ribonuclease-3
MEIQEQNSNQETGEEQINAEDDIELTRPHMSRQDIENILGMRPKNLDHYRRALVHKSIQRNVKRSQSKVLDYLLMSNERLEFLGDSVFGLIVSNYLFDKYPTKDEGFMTRTKTKIVCGKNCAKFAKELNLGNHLLMSRHVMKINGQNNDKLLEDAFEAFIGAVYKDLGFKYAQVFVYRLIDKYLDFNDILEDNNYKDILLRYSQAENFPLPTYKTVNEDGPPHKRIFTVVVSLGENEMGKGDGKNKKEAEQNAAKCALNTIDVEHLTKLMNRDLRC